QSSLALLRSVSECCSFFFFQAEDGIRDRNVTGVQTCALPIYGQPFDAEATYTIATNDFTAKGGDTYGVFAAAGGWKDVGVALEEIGRASCRERGWIWGGAG